MKARISISLCSVTFLFCFLSCQTPSQRTEKVSSLGTIEFPATSSPDAIEHFEQGVLLLHSFMYSEAAESFKKAQEIDKDFAMAYWGEAMTNNHPLWSSQNTERGQEILGRLAATEGERLIKAQTAFEKDMLVAVEILFGDGEKFERDDLYSQYMSELYEKYPDNHEVAAFYALSLLGSVEEGRDYEIYGMGAKIVEGILRENPNHPGALHYLIHSYDDPDHAPLAINAANNYSKVAPDAGHALHMPSHIYIAMGMWDEVISSNIRSFEARLKKNKQTGSSGWNLHAYHWLLYGYLQKNELTKAGEIMEQMATQIASNQSSYTKSYGIDMVGIFLAETGDWNGDYSSIVTGDNKLNIKYNVSQLFMNGYRSYKEGNAVAVSEILTKINEKINGASNQLATRGVTVCSGQSFATRPPNQDDIDIARVLALELQVAQALMSDADDEIIETLLQEATSLQNVISFSFGPPTIVIPSYEMYGNWLLEKGRFQDALDQFEKSLNQGPARRKALQGKLAAAKGLGDTEMVRAVQEILQGQLKVS